MRTVEFPDAILWTTEWLRTNLAANGYPSVRVGDTYKGTSPFEVWVQRDGGGQVSAVIERPRIRVNAYADGATSANVSALARRVVAIMLAGAGDGPVKRVVLTTGPTAIPDTRPRRYMLFDVDLKASDLTLS